MRINRTDMVALQMYKDGMKSPIIHPEGTSDTYTLKDIILEPKKELLIYVWFCAHDLGEIDVEFIT
eukprot:UN00394